MDRYGYVGAPRPGIEPSFACATRAVLALVRPEHLPTVFTNIVAGWWLCGAGNSNQLLIVLSGALAVFLGGAFLNDVFDISYDKRYRRDRIVPSGLIGLRTLWRVGILLLLGGTLLLQWPNRVTGTLAMLLALAVVLRNSAHRLLPISSGLLGACRFLLYVLGGSVAARGITGTTIWCGLAVGVYVFGLESLRTDDSDPRKRWPIWALATPVLLALVINRGPYILSSLILSGLVLSWGVLSWTSLTNVKPASEGNNKSKVLVSGIVLVDMLAACPAPLEIWKMPNSGPRDLCILFAGFFAASLILAFAQMWRCPASKPAREAGA